jgi:hypothetical protein
LDEVKVPPPPLVLLSVESDAEGMFDVTGHSKFFRFYSDDTIEFEVPDQQKIKPGSGNKTSDVNRTVVGTLSAVESKQLAKAIEDSLKDLPETFRRRCCCTDTQLDFDVEIYSDGIKRQSKLRSFCDIGDVKNRSKLADIPESVRELFITVDSLRLKYGYKE